MVKQFQVVIPPEKADHVLKVLKENVYCHHVYRLKGDEQHLIYFKCVDKKSGHLVELLSSVGVSVGFGSIDIVALATSKPRIRKRRDVQSMDGKAKKEYRLDDRLAYEEIYDEVDAQIHLTFDYLSMCAIGSIIAGVGLLQDSPVAVVASMLVSPLMGPILGQTFGIAVKDWHMHNISFRNEAIGVILCLFVGVCTGLVAVLVNDDLCDSDTFGQGTEIGSRGTLDALWGGIAIAVPSGAGVALGVTGGVINPLVGVAISAALLPPIVNAGLSMTIGGVLMWADEDDWKGCQNDAESLQNGPYNHLKVGAVSMSLFLINWVFIVIFGWLFFRVKRIHKSAKEDRGNRRMWRYLLENPNPSPRPGDDEEDFIRTPGSQGSRTLQKRATSVNGTSSKDPYHSPLLGRVQTGSVVSEGGPVRHTWGESYQGDVPMKVQVEGEDVRTEPPVRF